MSNPDPKASGETPEKPQLGPLPPGVKLPPKRSSASLRLPPRRKGPLLPVRPGKRCKCPYCGDTFEWPPEKLVCPSCGATVRPPPGHAPADMAQRRTSRENITQARDMAIRALGPRPGNKSFNRAYMIAALFVLSVVGGLLILGTTRPSVERKKYDPYEWTTNRMALYAMALEHFKTDVGRYPQYDELNLVALVSDMGSPGWNGPYLNKLRASDHADGWKTPWLFTATNGVARLVSAGPDRKFDTADDLETPPEWFRCHPDFQPRDPTAPPVPHDISVIIGPDESRQP